MPAPTPHAPAAPPTPAKVAAPTPRRRLLGAGAALALGAGLPAFHRHARAADVPRFALGVASGQPEPTRLVLWTRLTGLDLPAEVPVHWVLAHDEACTQVVARGTETARADSAHSVHAEPADLPSGRWFFYRFSALGQHSPVGRTRTAPALEAAAPLSAALASCQRWEHGHWAAWQQVAQQGHDLVLFVGDYIYEYAAPQGVRTHELAHARTLADYRARYALYKSDPALQAAHAACPWLLVWDDHEVANDYAGDTDGRRSGAAFLAQRAAAYQAFWEHQPLPAAWRPRGAHMRIHQRLAWGRLARLHLLDNRQHRHPQACPPPWRGAGTAGTVDGADCPELWAPERSLLGPEQEQWLSAGWDLARPWNLLVQQSLLAPLSRAPTTGPGTGRYRTDGWDGYAATRQRLLDGVAARRLPNWVVLGGDLHAHYAADLHAQPHDSRSPRLGSEFCGTSISSQGPAQATLDKLRGWNPHLHHARGDQRGHVALRLEEQGLQASLMAVAYPQQANSPVTVQARFQVEAGRPGIQAG